MPTWLILLLCAILAVGLFVLGMSLTLMIKGHNIDSEISTNKNMQKPVSYTHLTLPTILLV